MEQYHFKCSPFGLQKDSFCPVKGVLLACKTSPFASQKGYICFTDGFLFPCGLLVLILHLHHDDADILIGLVGLYLRDVPVAGEEYEEFVGS